MNILITGSRRFENYRMFEKHLIKILNTIPTDPRFVFGDCKGTDWMAKRFCQMNGYEYIEFKADWDKYGKKAGPMRNVEMIKYCLQSLESTICIAFIVEDSRGTRNCMSLASGADFKIHEINVEL